MADISKCNDIHCPAKEYCYRYTAKQSEFRQSWINTNRELDAYNCEMYWHNGKCRYCSKENGIHKISCPTHKIEIKL